MRSRTTLPSFLITFALQAGIALAQNTQTTEPTSAPAEPPPKTWIDSDTGHRVTRLTEEPNSGGFYFNINAYTPDGRDMVYTAPDGIHVYNFESKSARLLVPKPAHAVVVGHKTRSLYITSPADDSLSVVDIDTGTVRKLAGMPKRGKVITINADETLAAGTFIEGDGKDYGEDKRVMPAGLGGPNVQPLNKAQMMEDRLAAKLPMTLFTIDLRTGEVKKLLEHDTNWINHLLFSPADPSLLMYCHEGPWHKIDRIWTIRTDGTQNGLIHTRTMAMEIAGHEFWGLDGKTVWYDLQRPKGEDFILAGYNLETGLRRWYRMQRNEWSIHFNVTADESLMCGDGGDKTQVARAPDGQWIYLFRPELLPVSGLNDKTFVQPGVLRAEKLVNMAKHNYKAEPNVRFSPDQKMVIFTSNMFGPSYVFGVDVEKAPK